MKLLLAVLLVIVLVGVYGALKPLPSGLSVAGPVHIIPTEDAAFLSDITSVSSTGERVIQQEVFDEILNMIEGAQSYILLDFFFFSDFLGTETDTYRRLSSELTDALIQKKTAYPAIVIQVITDPINTFYGGHRSADFARLEGAGIPVIVTDLSALRDSNPLYSGVWRTAVQWFGVSAESGWLPNLLDIHKPDVTLRSYLASFNFKANHRKVLLADWLQGNETGIATLITSANPHDGSSANSNIAVRIDSALWKDVLESEKAVAKFSGADLILPPQTFFDASEETGALSVQLLTEQAIEQEALALIDSLTQGEELNLLMFYLSDRDIVQALKRADTRGVNIRILLDPNKDAFGREKNGIPNRQVAHELMTHTKGNTTVRWCNTNGEQCHAKMLLGVQGEESVLIQGSANFTRRNLDNLNLETDVRITGNSTSPVLTDARTLFEQLWSNQDSQELSVSYETYADPSLWKTIRYRVMEFTGVSRF